MSGTVIMWFRRDLRIADNPAFITACSSDADHLIPLFIDTDNELGREATGAAGRVWLHESLAALSQALEELGTRLVLRRGPAQSVLASLIEETGAEAVYWNRLYEPAVIERDKSIKSDLNQRGLDAQSYVADVLHEPWTVETGQGNPYKVFTPFWRAIRQRSHDAPLAVPGTLPSPPEHLESLALSDSGLMPAHDWPHKLLSSWKPGEAGAHERLERFVSEAAANYSSGRNQPATSGTSLLAPHLHFGEIGPRQVMHRIREWQHQTDQAGAHDNSETFLSEIGWREFGRHVLFYQPQTPYTSMDERFADFPWVDDAAAFQAWKRGETGVPMVDAGMRELWARGTMHNRLRMTVASFLTKNLRIAWQHGERWFWHTLVDADLASNVLGWQWAAGCGADAVPFFRIFNPARQGERFDPEGHYVQYWVPELADMPAKHVHAPWQAPSSVLASAGVVLGTSYPQPIVDLKSSRAEALAAFETIKRST